MSGIADLATLLRTLQPVLHGGTYVFCTVPDSTPPDDATTALARVLAHAPLCVFREDEGITLIIERTRADAAGLAYGPVFRWLTLGVHSSLEAVGLLAVVTQALAARGVSVNAVSACYHDHLFVPVADANTALAVLRGLAAG